MGIDYQLHRVSVNVAKGFREMQKAGTSYYKDDMDRSLKQLNKGLDYFSTATDHLLKAEDDASNKAGNEIDKGNKALQKSIDAYGNGKIDNAEADYDSAMGHYDNALDLIGA